MKILVSKHFPPKGYSAISLFGFLIAREKYPSERTINHEEIHFAQQIEMLFIPFFIWYGIEYLIKLVYHRSHFVAYRNISFEREAWMNERNMDYLKRRKLFSWIRYIWI